MRAALIFSSVVIAVSLVGACDGPKKFAVNAKGVTGSSGTGLAKGKDGMTGHWEFVESATGVDSHRGGACLLESLSDFTGKVEQCQDVAEATDCAARLPVRLKTAGYASYCVSDTKTCWVRPENQGEPGGVLPHRLLACNRSIDYLPNKEWDPGQYVTNDVPIAPPSGHKSHWRVAACIFGNEGCVESLGPVTEVAAVGLSRGQVEAPNTPGVAPKSPPPHPEALNPVVNQ